MISQRKTEVVKRIISATACNNVPLHASGAPLLSEFLEELVESLSHLLPLVFRIAAACIAGVVSKATRSLSWPKLRGPVAKSNTLSDFTT